MTLGKALIAWIVISVIGWGIMGIDKARARSGGERVPEAHLLIWALFGAIGIKAGQRSFRHKTTKQPFARWLNAVLAVHLIAAATLFFNLAAN